MRKILIVLLVLSSCLSAIGQVNLQTGSATFNLPMFNWQDDKSRLNAVVALSYNSGNGLKVNSVASNVGQGWDLLAGGVITRMQVGEPDDQMQNDGNGTIEDINKYPAGYLYNPVDAQNGCPVGLVNYPIFGDQNHVYKQHNTVAGDRELDQFAFQFNGRSGLFVLGKNNGDKGVLLGDSKVKVWFQRDPGTMASQHIRTTISAFYVQDESGLIYTFSQVGLTKLLRTHPNYPGQNYPNVQPMYRDGLKYYENNFDEIPLSANPYKVDSWYLTQIEDPLTHRKVTLNYTTRNFDSYAGDAIKLIFSGTASRVPTIKSYIIITRNRTITQTPEITSIQCPDGHVVTVNYNTDQPRVDFAGAYPVKSIDITYNNRNLSSFQLNTTYFIFNKYGTPSTPAQRIAARLCLRSVTKLGVDLKEDEPPYVFDYFLGSNTTEDFVPPPFYYIKDVWGFYNGNSVNNIRPDANIPIYTNELTDISAQLYNQLNFAQLSTLCFKPASGAVYSYPTIKAGYAKNGLLKSITFPTRRVLTYEYQQNINNNMTDVRTVNRGNVNGNDYTGGVHVSKVIQSNGEDPTVSGNSMATAYNYIDATGSLTSQWGVVSPRNNTSSAYFFKLEGAHHPVFGSCHYDYEYPGVLSREVSINIPDSRASDVAIMRFISTAATVYTLASDIYLLISVGDPVMLIFDAVMIVGEYLLTNCDDDGTQGSSLEYTNSNIVDEGFYPVQFSRVEVVPINNSPDIGKTVYEFTDFSDYPLWEGLPNVSNYDKNPYPKKQRYAYWAYGLPKRVTVYDNSGKIVNQTENVYNWNYAQSPANTGYTTNCYIDYYSSQRSDSWSGLSNPGNVTYTTSNTSGVRGTQLVVDITRPYTGRVQMQDTYERNYKQSDPSQYLQTSVHYDYNAGNYQVSKATTRLSNGDEVVKETYYPGDYTSAIMNTLVTNNIVEIPVATYSSVLKSGSSFRSYIGASVIDFAVLPNGDIRASRNLTGRSAVPEANFTFKANNPFNYPGLTETGSFTYDASGNLIRLTDEGGRVVSNIYDYNDKLVIASIINADQLTDKCAYTSFETQNFGGWVLSGGANYTTAAAVTGTQAFALNGSSLTAALNTNKRYKLTCWATGPVNITGATATLVTSGPVNNQFTYYEYEIAQGPVSISVSGNVNIDELRLYPKAARMRTVTYDPLIGKTSECDENNRISYYEYDNLGRLRLIKDENRNIIKMYEYNFKK